MLHGRDLERARIADLLDGARHGRAGLLLIHGEPGVGKSALLEDAVNDAGDACILRTVGLESESPLAFAALHRLLRPVLPLVEKLPDPQARALRVAFGQEEGRHVDPFLVALATLSLLTDAGESRPVFCLIDDAQWLDVASADAILFAARRVDADPIALIFTARDGEERTFRPDGVPAMLVGGLDEAAVRALLEERRGPGLADHVSVRLLSETGGNPLALVELPGQLSTAQLQGTEPLPGDLRLTVGVERVFLERCRRLSHQAQTLMLVAAADDTARLATVLRAALRLGVPADSLLEVEQTGLLLTDGDTLRFRHPLVRSAVYQAATGLERREAHAVLAEALDQVDDLDRQAWHRAAAADGPDESVVASLAAAGLRAERRGGYVAAAAAYERAAELTSGERARAERLFAAARNAYACGQTARARAMLSTAREHADGWALRADIDRLRGRIEVNVGSAPDAHRIFVRAARAVSAHDNARALEMAAAAAVLASHGADSGASLEVDEIVAQVSDTASLRSRCLKQLLVSLTLEAHGELAEGSVALQQALDLGLGVEDRDVLANLGNAAFHAGDDAAHRKYLALMLSGAREDGAGMEILYALHRLPFSLLTAGQWSAVRSCADEALALSIGLSQRSQTAMPLAWLTLLAALEGRPDYDSLLAELENLVEAHPLGVLADPVHDLVRWAKGTRAGHDGETSLAFHHLSRLRLTVLKRVTALDRLNAAVRADERDQAQVWLAELTSFAEQTGRPWALAAVDHGRALLAPAEEACVLFESSLSHHATAGRPYDLARTQLSYGELLRRSHRRVDSRTYLRPALETFQDLHAEPLIARTSQELRASGETARKRDPSTLVDLTPMELQVARLVSQGMSNKEVAAQCWVSPRTVAFHLRNIFTKTGVTSRGELAQLDLG